MATKAEKDANAKWRRLRYERDITHVRVGERRGDENWVALIGTLAELHGPKGVCRCCYGRRSS
jgi:hypothetical protein